MNQRGISISLVCEGKELKSYAHEDQDFVKAPKDGNYIIRVKNTDYRRKLAVISVDGINIVDGEAATPQGSGYVIGAYETVNIKGWKRTDNEAAAFQFAELEKSYAAQTEHGPSNVGVIGVAVFDEKVKYKSSVVLDSLSLNNDMYRSRGYLDGDDGLESYSMPMAGGASIKPINESIGTGYGEKTEFKTSVTTFDRDSEIPTETIVIRYATEQTLVKWGVIKESLIPAVNPFPGVKISVKEPAGWTGEKIK